jgi:hypothetical protein
MKQYGLSTQEQIRYSSIFNADADALLYRAVSDQADASQAACSAAALPCIWPKVKQVWYLNLQRTTQNHF